MAESQQTTPTVRERPRSAGRSLAPLTGLRSEIDALFDSFLTGTPFGAQWRSEVPWAVPGAGAPAIDVADTDDQVRIQAELPGLREDDIDVRLADGAITISGEKKKSEEHGEQDGGYRVSERYYGAFSRTIPLPEGIDRDNIDASFDKGVLTVTVPKTAEARESTRRIKVHGS